MNMKFKNILSALFISLISIGIVNAQSDINKVPEKANQDI